MKCTACPQINNIKEALFNSRYTLVNEGRRKIRCFPPLYLQSLRSDIEKSRKAREVRQVCSQSLALICCVALGKLINHPIAQAASSIVVGIK